MTRRSPLPRLTKLSGWGRFPIHDAAVFAPRDEAAVLERVTSGQAIARGNGRAYGDSAVSRQNTVHMRHFDRMISFDPATGELVAEAGVLLGDIIAAFLPHGWFPFVTPGTKFVTLGGMIAADVHGKNHHRDGSLRRFVNWIDLVEASGTIRRCSPHENSELFEWTIGGMGLTGVVLRAAIRLRAVETAWIRQRILPARTLEHAIELMEETEDATYSVAWLDCLSGGERLGRSLVTLGEHARLEDLGEVQRRAPLTATRNERPSVPIDLPGWVLNRFSVGLFNALSYRSRGRHAEETLVDWDRFFYPLDAVLDWNRIYGRRGLTQFQCVLPLEHSRAGVRTLIEAVSTAGPASFLAVLKRLGEQQGGYSFPMAGYTLALDFPVTAKTLELMRRLDEITLAYGGRFNLAKDGRLTADALRRSDGRTETFVQLRRDWGMRDVFCSAQSARLEL